MRIVPTIILTAALAVAAGQGFAAEDKPAAEASSTFKDDREKASYGIGVNIGSNIKRSGMDIDVDVLANAIKDVMAGKEPKLNDQQAREAIMGYQQQARTKQADKNKKEGEAFLAENKKKEGVKTKSITLQDGTTAELQYKVITPGTGETPKSNDTVNVNYKGTLVNGKEFDSSAKHGGPAKFQVNRVVRGWTEALQMMKVGGKWEVYMPASLGYGDFGSGPTIEPGSALVFEIELLGIEPPPPPPAPAQPLTSDIIKVPSAEELKKGAKVEVLKAEDVERELKAAAATNSAAKTNKPKTP